MLEVNPLVITKEKKLACLDAKVGFDDNALFKHADAAALRDITEEDAKETEAAKYDLNYVALDGAIGCMVNGAGLAMATMDIIKLYGLEPANFLDVGGSATKEKVAAAFKIITSDPKVKGILVNIFGGIMKCDDRRRGRRGRGERGWPQGAAGRAPRRDHTVDLGKKIIAESKLNVVSGDDLDDAAQKIVAAVKKAASTHPPGHRRASGPAASRPPPRDRRQNIPTRRRRRAALPPNPEGEGGDNELQGRQANLREAGGPIRRGGGPRHGRGE